MEITFDQAVELLEIADISAITAEDVAALERKAKKRWHPDRVAHLKNPAITEEYTIKFQQIETAGQMISAFLRGEYHAGDAFTRQSGKTYEEPEEVIRKNAPDIQATLKQLWTLIKERKYKWQEKEVVLSDGFKLKDLLHEDFKEDIAMLSVVSFFYGLLFFGILVLLASFISPVIATIVGIVWALQALSCLLGFAPLSRFWIKNEQVQKIMFGFINFGLSVYNWAERESEGTSNGILILLVQIPVLFAKLIKYVVLFPLYELAKAIVGEKVVGVVKQHVQYYADAADWYVDELLNKRPAEMTREELFHLSHLYTELRDVKANT